MGLDSLFTRGMSMGVYRYGCSWDLVGRGTRYRGVYLGLYGG